MNTIEYFRSISEELDAIKNRIRNLMDNPHWLTDGEIKEAILRNVIKRYMPENIKVGKGFIFSDDRCSSQIDILIYDTAYPVLFKEGDLVFVTPDAVKGIIEVKSLANSNVLVNAFEKLANNASLINDTNCFIGLFSYEVESLRHQTVLEKLQLKVNGNMNNIINHVCLGETNFYKFWFDSPNNNINEVKKWHAYELEKLAPAYFINNLLNYCSNGSIGLNQNAWFPLDSKERHKIDEISLI